MPDTTEELKTLQTDLANKLKESDDATSSAKAIRARIEGVQRQIGEQDKISQAILAKKTAYANDKLAEAIADGLKSIPAALEATSPGAQKKVDAALDSFDQDTKTQQKNLDGLQNYWTTKASAAKQAENDVATARKAFEDSFKAGDAIGAQVEQIKALRAKMNQGENSADHVAAYVYAKEASKLVAGLDFPDAAKLAKTLSDARKNLFDATTALDTARNDVAAAKAKLDDATKALNTRLDNRLSLLVEAARKA